MIPDYGFGEPAAKREQLDDFMATFRRDGMPPVMRAGLERRYTAAAMCRWTVGALAAGLLFGYALGSHTAQGAELYAGLQGEATDQLNTHNDDRYEASSETIPAVSLFGGLTLAPWLDAEVRLSWRYQRAHGRNGFGGPTNEPGYGKQSVDGHQYAVSALACPRLKTPWDWPITFYARGCAGPGYSWTDTTRTNITGERHDRAGVVLSYEGAVGLERELGAGVSVRLEGGYANASPVEQTFGGLALVYSFGG